MLKLNYKILLINCTEKINIYKMFLSIIIRIISLNNTYYIALIFLLIETINNYY